MSGRSSLILNRWFAVDVAHPGEGGTPQLVADRLERAAVSPEGTLLAGAYCATPAPLFRCGVSPIAGGKPVYESPGYSSGAGPGPFQWTKDGTALLYSTGRTDEHPGPRLAGRPAQRFTDFTDLTVFASRCPPTAADPHGARDTIARRFSPDELLITNLPRAINLAPPPPVFLQCRIANAAPPGRRVGPVPRAHPDRRA